MKTEMQSEIKSAMAEFRTAEANPFIPLTHGAIQLLEAQRPK